MGFLDKIFGSKEIKKDEGIKMATKKKEGNKKIKRKKKTLIKVKDKQKKKETKRKVSGRKKEIKKEKELSKEAKQDKYQKFVPILLKMKQDILGNMSEKLAAEKEEKTSYIKEPGDDADESAALREQELSLVFSDRDRRKIMDINDALKRISDGSYGICEECGEEIPIGRLEIMPFAKYCIECKERVERKNRSKKRLKN